MAAKKRGLGKGLDSMIPQKQEPKAKEEVPVSETNGSPFMMDIHKIEPNRDQPRKNFDEDALQELADSISQKGVLEPLLVFPKDDYYMIVSGERRWRAAKKANVKEVPVIIRDDLTEQEILEIALIENIQREDLNPIEEALTYKRLLEEFNLKQDEVAERVSKSRTSVTNSMRLLKLDERVQQMVIDGRLTTGHVRPMLAIVDQDKQYEFAMRCFDTEMTVRDVEKEVKKIQKDGTKDPKDHSKKLDPQLEVIYGDISEKMKKILGTKVLVVPKDNTQGKVEIEYYSQDELNRIYELIQSIHFQA